MANAQNVGAVPAAHNAPMTKEEKKVILASSLGTVFEWYDFYLYGSLAAVIAKQFFAGLDPTSAFIFALLAFAAGFIVRPFGALVFGRLGDMIGRKYTFLVTILIMGFSTFIVGLLPGYATIGWAAPIILILLRMLQGLALGGEYGGAATYVAEHAPHGKRGAYTAWIQTTATLGLFLSLIVILLVREATGTNFEVWGWRIPFLVSILLLAMSVYIRLSMSESPAFQKMKAEGKTSKAPLTEAFGQWRNLKIVILALVGLTAGQAVVWYTGQFYSLFFLTQVLKVDAKTANLLIAGALVIGTPFFIFFGSLSDKIGRKWIIMLGCALAVLTYFPLFKALTHYANPALERAQQSAQIVVTADPATCSFQGSPIAREIDFRSSCDIVKRTLAQASASYEVVNAPAGTVASVKIGDKEIKAFDATVGKGAFDDASKKQIADFKKAVSTEMTSHGYPTKADPAQMNTIMVLVILVILVIYVTMVYGPIAAMLVEMFPTRIRYSSMSLPYHIGNGWFGGLLPTISFALVAQNGNIYYGLWYPIIIAAMTFVLGALFIRETKDVDIYAND
ncbi:MULTISPECIES: MFS transporter [unclassified Cupriavidus]|uniref:MFS transporter n=1 Tax=unclassified Cupriavidus TaxID=2640874 RepID=UPI001C002E35|nr:MULTISPECIES: MFS transporter [unclassified Cupriavidus]MCA3187306.1 MHS family MFS transporter [Cupriavidus sp.]MCA3190243.1 MHS family MFS transporter [Cupriavidus sp.]MCA3196947.1 MHS family MFS transporter [Cupriavidus sp.]MCA3202224.1 MHS family MFS transporter [Cupriavidus sp.]MCA3208204.1 MHS family MFS transporter [Cupriavidus sp.]